MVRLSVILRLAELRIRSEIDRIRLRLCFHPFRKARSGSNIIKTYCPLFFNISLPKRLWESGSRFGYPDPGVKIRSDEPELVTTI